MAETLGLETGIAQFMEKAGEEVHWHFVGQARPRESLGDICLPAAACYRIYYKRFFREVG